jgi:signal transduction histidine kinase
LGIAGNVNPSKTAPQGNHLSFKVLHDGREVSPEELPMQFAASHGVALRDLELDVLRADGTLLNLLEYASPLYDEHGKVRGSLGVFVDITHRKAAERRLSMLYEIARALAESSSIHAAARRVLQTICAAMGWEFGALWRVESNTPMLTNEGVWHLSAELRDLAEATDLSILSADAGSLLGRVRQGGQPIWVSNLTDETHSSRAAEAHKAGLHCALGFPILSGNKVIAIVECLSDHIQQPDSDLMETLHAIGNQVGIFLERKRVEEALALRASQQHLLAQPGILLSASVDYETRFANVARLVVPDLADWCVIHTVDAAGSVQPFAMAHLDPGKEKLLYEVYQTHTLNSGQRNAIDEALQIGSPQLLTDSPDSLLEAAIGDPDRLDIVHQLEPKSAMIVPLTASGRTLGTMTFVFADSRRRYGPNDLELAQDLTQRVALAMDNAQLYAEAQRLNAELEHRVKVRTDQLETANYRLIDEIIERRRAEEQVRILNAELEQRVVERTAQLETVNADLQKEIAGHQQASQSLRRLLERTRELYRISQAIGAVRTPDEVLQVLLSSSYLETASRASIAIFDQAWLKEDVPPSCCNVLAAWNRDTRQPNFVDRQFTLEEYGVVPPYSFGQPIIIEDMQSQSRLSETALKRFADLRTSSLIIFPLVAGGEWYGLLSLHFESRRVIGAEDLQHLRGLVDEVAIAIKNLRLLEAESRARREAEQANDLKLKFLAMISHELRTPLTSIKGFATTLLAEDVEWDITAQRDFLHTIDEEADKLGDLIEQLLDLSRMEAGMLRMAPSEQTFADILSTAMTELQTLAAERTLVIEAPLDLPSVYADGERIAQVLINLVGNAAKYSPPQTTITISAHRENGAIQVDIADQGPGIALQDRARVFEAFRRLEDDTGHRAKGAGLGLAICKGIVEAHGGRIWIQDRAGPGTAVSFTLPLHNDPHRPPVASREHLQW